MADTVTLTGPKWFLYNLYNPYKEGRDNFNLNGCIALGFIKPGKSLVAEVHYDSIYFPPDQDHSFWGVPSAEDPYWQGDSILFYTTVAKDLIDNFKAWINDYLNDCDDPFTIKLPVTGIQGTSYTFSSVATEGLYKGFLLNESGDNLAYFRGFQSPAGDPTDPSCWWRKFRFIIGDKYYRQTEGGNFYLDPNQKATRPATFTTECTTTSVSVKSTAGDKTSNKSFAYVNKDATSDAIVSFATKLNALSTNTPKETVRTDKRDLFKSVIKEDNIFNVEVDYSEIYDTRSKFIDSDNTRLSTIAATSTCVAAVNYTSAESLDKIKSIEENGYWLNEDYGADIEVMTKGGNYKVTKIIDVETGKTPTYVDKIGRDEEDDDGEVIGFTPLLGQVNPPVIQILKNIFSEPGTKDTIGVITKQVDITFTLEESSFYKGDEKTLRVTLLQANVWEF